MLSFPFAKTKVLRTLAVDHIFVFTEHLYVICPYLVAVVSSEYFVDWIKHAFITKFNNIPVEVSYIYILLSF